MILLYDVIYIWHVFIHIVLLLLLLQQVLLFVIVCRMENIAAGSLDQIPSSALLLFIQTRRILMYVPLGNTVAFTASTCLIGSYGHARSQGGRHPAAAKPPLYVIPYNII